MPRWTSFYHCSFVDVLSDSIHSMMSSSSSSFGDRCNIKTNGSLIHSPTSPRGACANAVFNYNNNSSRITSTSNPTYHTQRSYDQYQDDTHLYDCPADFVKPEAKTNTAVPAHGLVLSSSMNASVYADDTRIYDAPAEIMVTVAPPVPSHSRKKSTTNLDRLSNESVPERKAHHSVDSVTSSELTLVSSAESYKTAVPELSTSFTDNTKVRQLPVNDYLHCLPLLTQFCY